MYRTVANLKVDHTPVLLKIRLNLGWTCTFGHLKYVVGTSKESPAELVQKRVDNTFTHA